ncbi:5'/3'-nucleotidase SurE [Paracoccus aminophilus]|uniref:5'-nucleotidase SurE n=1 Tax=Paracoccus aminophilus JCM 7686 TaxID=1367847 RepID=S5YYN7_PARAH|nr:5'/3'-nucleotidase SurE [Paracoccus aminophilus]AGT10326.1 5'-nucleotidase [Paracoccus aminophilus JCM 7686]
MRILITNDDGINAPGLEALTAIAREVAGPEGEVWTVAPAFEQSGVGHAISYTHPTMIAELGPRRFAAEGSPADCVLAALYHVLKDCPPDLVLSGVNRGNNSGENAVYSGTIGAAMEAALQGVPAMALSQYMGKGNNGLADPFEAARMHAPAIIRQLLDHGAWGADDAYRLFYNVNFPACPASEVKGTRAAAQGRRHGSNFSVAPAASPSGRQFLWAVGGSQTVAATEGSDVDLNLQGYVSVTPMRADLTCHDSLRDLRGVFDQG